MPVRAQELSATHELFDGEKNWGALLAGWRILPLQEIRESFDLLNELIDQNILSVSLQGAVPWIATSQKNSIVVLSDGCIAEIDYEGGVLLYWSASFHLFLEVMIEICLGRMEEGVDEGSDQWKGFTEKELASLDYRLGGRVPRYSPDDKVIEVVGSLGSI